MIVALLILLLVMFFVDYGLNAEITELKKEIEKQRKSQGLADKQVGDLLADNFELGKLIRELKGSK